MIKFETLNDMFENQKDFIDKVRNLYYTLKVKTLENKTIENKKSV